MTGVCGDPLRTPGSGTESCTGALSCTITWNPYVGLDGTLPFAGVVWSTAGPSGRIVGDAPGQGLEPPATQYRIAGEPFKLYLMYAPPTMFGYESRFAALLEISWSWSGTANYTGSQWEGPVGADP